MHVPAEHHHQRQSGQEEVGRLGLGQGGHGLSHVERGKNRATEPLRKTVLAVNWQAEAEFVEGAVGAEVREAFREGEHAAGDGDAQLAALLGDSLGLEQRVVEEEVLAAGELDVLDDVVALV